MLNVITVEEAIEILKNNFSGIAKAETVYIDEAVGRITAEDIESGEDVPSFSRSTMDGYALCAADTYGSGESMPAMLDIAGEIFMGERAEITLERGKCVKISTGGMLPDEADAVIPVENTDEDCGMCLTYKSVSPFENVTKKGDDIKRGECIIKKGTVLSPAHIGLLASVGKSAVSVVNLPAVGIISTGNEIIGIDEKLTEGKIREVNSHLLSALCSSYGCEVKFFGTVKDEYDEILSAVKSALRESDIVLVSGGSSAGTKDMTVKVIEAVGEVFAHGLAMKPGKPTIIGRADGKAVFGLPGHPAACYFVTEIIVKRLIDILLGRNEKNNSKTYRTAENISSNHGREEYICVKTDGETAVPVYGKSGLLSTLCESDGYIRIDRNREGLKKGETVEVFSFGGNYEA